ncbi:ATP-binding cassette domain-containing protein [Allokutzneria sp. NRRL B-24872]|uniref:ATP-binding cassette domain-containing protein n=1 Tax=Allokutzneria sp. NRRL B-24872 TaxID=1137961 RepID=UPI000A384399|nr:ABC transporter ATP-binding protein [Allokutzneria sp. NRRL B-24872]
MLHVENLTVRHGNRLVLDRLSLTAVPGRVTALIGAPGAGKTTFARCVAGALTPESGQISLLGNDVREYDHTGRVVGGAHEPSSRSTGRAAAREVTDLLGLPSAVADAALERVELGGVAANRIETYPLGMRQRLALCLALLGNRPIVVLDEPFDRADLTTQRVVHAVLSERAREGATVLVTSRDLRVLGAFADDVVLLRDGRAQLDGTVAELVVSHREDLYASEMSTT